MPPNDCSVHFKFQDSRKEILIPATSTCWSCCAGALVSTGAGSAAPVLAAVPFIWPAFLRLAQPSRGNAGPHRHLATPSLFSEFEHLCSTPQRTSLTASSTQARGPGEKQVEDSEALRRKVRLQVSAGETVGILEGRPCCARPGRL